MRGTNSIPGRTCVRGCYVCAGWRSWPRSPTENLALQVDLVRHADLRFDALFSAEHFRHYKPDAETYLGAVELLDLAPRDVMLVAAHNGDLAAARACGLRTAFVARPDEHGPARRDDLAAEPGVELAVNSLTELAESLRP